MPRKGHIAKRDVLPDPMYDSKLVTKLINNIMLDGKRGTAQNILYNAFKKVEETLNKPPLSVFEEALDNIMPTFEVQSPPHRGSKLSSSCGSAGRTSLHPRVTLAHPIRPVKKRKNHGRTPRQRNHGCCQWRRRRG